MAEETVVFVASDEDIISARQRGRQLAERLGFSATDRALIATAISELARNILTYAKRGAVILRALQGTQGTGIEVVARDDGPGIADLSMVMKDGFSTSGGLGLGLPGVRRMMDQFDIASKPGEGTVVTARKWNN